MKKIIYLLLPIQIIILLSAPRFGWNIHNYDARVLQYEKISYVDGDFHALYKDNNDVIDICYKNRFSRQLTVTVNSEEVYYIEVEIDGNISACEPDLLKFTSNDIVWNDSCGILYWRYIVTIIMTLFSIRLIKLAKYNFFQKSGMLYACSFVIYLLSLLISLRIIL